MREKSSRYSKTTLRRGEPRPVVKPNNQPASGKVGATEQNWLLGKPSGPAAGSGAKPA